MATTKPMPRAERVKQLETLRQIFPGRTQSEYGRMMGLGRSGISQIVHDPTGLKQRQRRDSYNGVCEDCGGVSKSDGTSRASRLCFDCAVHRQKASRYWTRERIIEAIQEWARFYGKPPIATDWKTKTDSPITHPVMSNVYGKTNPFTSWGDAIEAAGFPYPRRGLYPRTERVKANMRAAQAHRRWTHEKVIERIHAFHALHGRVPGVADLGVKAGLPNPQTLRKNHWSWPALVRDAGLTPLKKGRVSARSAAATKKLTAQSLPGSGHVLPESASEAPRVSLSLSRRLLGRLTRRS